MITIDSGVRPLTDERLYLTLLFDLYGRLLTDRQQELMVLRYYDDLSLSEIADLSGGSRQGVWDTLRRAEAVLMEIEEKTGLASRLRRLHETAAQLQALTGQLLPLTDGRARELCLALQACAATLEE